MSFASGRYAKGECDRCGGTFALNELRDEVVKGARVNRMVCWHCHDEDHPQLQDIKHKADPEALRAARPYNKTDVRAIQWGWAPVGGSRDGLTPNSLLLQARLGSVTVTTA